MASTATGPGGSATPGPTTPGSAFERTEFQLGELLAVDELWGLGDRVMAHGSIFGDTSYFLTLGAGNSWPLTSPPPAIGRYLGGLALDDRLWFLVLDTGIRGKESTLRLAGTRDGENWKASKPSDLDADVIPRFLGHIDDAWVTGYIGEGGNIEIGAPQFLRWSRDGTHWSPAMVPTLRGIDPFDVAFHAGQSTTNVMVVSTSVDRPAGGTSVLLISQDGIEWREVDSPVEPTWASTLTCNDALCILTRSDSEDAPMAYPTPIAWVSRDGLTWSPSRTLLEDAAAGSGLSYVAADADGFVGIDRETNRVWTSSPDGLTWRPHETLPALRVPIIDLAVGADAIVALEEQPDVEPQGAWVGSVAELRAAD